VQESTSLIVSSPLFCPASDKRFWSSLRGRIDTLLENRHRSVSIGQDQLNLDPSLGTNVVSFNSKASAFLSNDYSCFDLFVALAHTGFFLFGGSYRE
jgi:hypothetical protein